MFAHTQVALLGKAPVASGSAAHLMDWSQLSRRTLLEASGASSCLGLWGGGQC